MTQARPWAWTKLAFLATLPACASLYPGFYEAPQPVVAPELGRVVLFTGLNWSGETHRATGTDALAQEIRRAGVPSDVYRPGEWARAADDVLALEPRPAAIAVYGYSAGGPAAARFAKQLGEAGVQVETMVLLEPWGSAEVACTVRLAIQYRLEQGDTLLPAKQQCTEVRNELIDPDLTARGGGLGHLSVAVDPDVMRLVMRQLVQGGSAGVRLRKPESLIDVAISHD
jgi:pimeloyl-ACP methyl ester carboxylesterase